MTATVVAAPPAPRLAPEAERLRPLRTYATGVAALSGVGLVFRVAFLGSLPYWRDEAFTAQATRMSWTGMFDTVRNDSAPPLGYILGHLAASISASPVSLRLLSALAGTAAIPIAAALARRAGGDRAGLCGAAVAAVMPTLLVTSRDARMYSLAITLVMLAALTLVRALERPDRGRLVVHAAVVALAVHTHYLTALAIAALLGAAVVLRPPPRSWMRCVLATAAGALTLVPWLIAARAQFQHSGFWLPLVDTGMLEDVTTEFFRGPRLSADVPLYWVAQTGAVVAGVGGFLGAALAVRRLGVGARRQAGFLALAGALGVGVLIAVSTRRPFFDGRYAGLVWAPLLPLLGAGAAALRPRVLTAVILVALALCGATVLTEGRTDWPAITAMLDSTVGPRDELVLNTPDYLVIIQYADAHTVADTHLLNRTGPPWYWGTAAYAPGTVVRSLQPGPDTYWIVGDFGPTAPVPAGYRVSGPQRCVERFCITPFTR